MIALASQTDLRPTITSTSGDRQFCAAAKAALDASNYGSLRKLSCRVSDGVVEISGCVSSFYLKQLAQAAVLHLNPRASIRNLVEVIGEPELLVVKECQTRLD